MSKLSEKLLKLGNINGKIIFELPNGELTTQYNFS